MKLVRYSRHLEIKLKSRKITYDLPKDIYQMASERYLDIATGLLIAIKQEKYQSKIRDMAVTYKETNHEIILITIHPLKFNQKTNRIKSKRWQKI